MTALIQQLLLLEYRKLAGGQSRTRVKRHPVLRTHSGRIPPCFSALDNILVFSATPTSVHRASAGLGEG